MQEAPAAAAPGEPMDLNTAIQVVMKKALAHDGLARGLHESARSIERGQAQVRRWEALGGGFEGGALAAAAGWLAAGRGRWRAVCRGLGGW